MEIRREYLQEIQKFTTSQYWNSGVRITAGVLIPMFLMISQDWLTTGIPFLFGALFVSLTDTPGPIHHRRNGMLAAIALNTFTALVTGYTHDHQLLLLTEVVVFSFSFSLFGIYGARAGAIGTLALVIMSINMSPRQDEHTVMNAALTAGGGLWYALFSLLLYRLQPYRLVEQAMGENLLMIAEYVRARAAFYKEGTDVEITFNRVMKEQVEVLKSQTQIRELLFKTRQFVADASPRSRSLMMIFLESLDLFEETMYSYQDYKLLHKNISADLLNKFYRSILQVVAEFELIGLSVQSGIVIKKIPSLEITIHELEQSLNDYKTKSLTPEEAQSVRALEQTLKNIHGIVNRLTKIILYTRMEAHDPERFPDQDIEKPPGTEPITFSLLRENFTFKSNTFRYATRLSIALVVGFVVASLFELGHAYWVMLTIITILKPVYNLTKERNIQRVAGTLGGVLIASGILYLISNTTVLMAIMIICMLMAYSLLRLTYLGFVTFLTIYVLITFHFLNPIQFKSLIGERLIDTLVGSVVAALAARFIFPVWQHYTIQSAMKKMLLTSTTYMLSAWNAFRNASHRTQYNAARNEAIVALTNLSDNFQQMLAEPEQSLQYPETHQFVIASHTLISRISALTPKDFGHPEVAEKIIEQITDALQKAEANLNTEISDLHSLTENSLHPEHITTLPALHPLSIILSLSKDIKTITTKLKVMSETKVTD